MPALSQESADTIGTGGAVAGQTTAKGYTPRLQNIVRGPGSSETGRSLVVLSSSPDAKAQASLQEDLAVMYHILDKAIDDTLGSDQHLQNALGVNLYFVPDSGHMRSSYFEGYGALFLFRVNFPLLPAANKAEAQKEDKQVSSEWEEARQEVFGNPSEPGAVSTASGEPYNEERVNRLKSALLEALKNAANILDLRQDEGVTICVLGGTKAIPHQSWSVAGQPGARAGDIALLTGQFNKTPHRGTVLTIRAKKADIDSFAKGQMNLDEFTKKSRVNIYEGDTGADAAFGNYYGSVGFGGGGGGGFGGSYVPAKR
jgi:hypothetical protein